MAHSAATTPIIINRTITRLSGSLDRPRFWQPLR
jgi:hypothetical protein